MSLLLFSASAKGAGKRLQRLVEVQFPTQKTEVCRTIKDLSARLRGLRYNLDVAVLLVTIKNQLGELLTISDLLDGLRIILILPDWKRDTIVKGHTLRPRFLTYADTDFSDIGAVLNKMLERASREQRNGNSGFQAILQ